MLLTKKVNITINSSNIKHYKELGFLDIKVKEKLFININQLSKGSNIFIDAECDICHKIKKIKYIRYLENIKKYNIFSCSRKCATIKRIKTNNEKYGVDNISQNKEIKNKIKKGNLKKFGVECVTKNQEIKDKIKKTNLEKYGYTSPSKNEEIKQKIKSIFFEKYGVEHPLQNTEIYNKLTKTNLKKYGKKTFMQTDEFKEKSKQTNLKKYGNENYKNIDKIIKTNLEKYGVEWYTKTEEYKIKSKQTNFEKYGVSNPNKNNIIREKSNKTRKKNRLKELENYKIINIDYKNNIYTFKCDSGCEHEFNINYDTFKNRKKYGINLCTICNDYLTKSGSEKNIYNFIKNYYDNEIIQNNRTIISKELDIYLPNLKLAFEFNGLFWHNEVTKDINYHLNKTEECESQGIQLIQIYEDDWLYKQDIVKSMILNKLGKIENRIYARKAEIKEINDDKLVIEFLNKNHIQGFIGSKVKLGLFYENELVSLMTFGNRRLLMGKKTTNQSEYELLRFCNKLNTNVIGGASKLFKYFIDNYQPKEITTYADRSYSQGKLYEVLGFKFIGKTKPNYYYIIDGIRKHRFNFRKDMLVKKGYDSNKTEHEIMLERKIYRIYDSGNSIFSL